MRNNRYRLHDLPASKCRVHERHATGSICLRYSFSLCPKRAKGVTGVQGQVRVEPMTLVNGNERLTLKFDCRACEMHVIGKMKPGIRAEKKGGLKKRGVESGSGFCRWRKSP